MTIGFGSKTKYVNAMNDQSLMDNVAEGIDEFVTTIPQACICGICCSY